MKKEKKHSVFLSYPSEYRDAATKIAEKCRASGIDVWLDWWETRPGANIQESITTALDKCDTVIVLVGSNRSAKGNWLSKEWAQIQQTVWEDDEFRVLPVTVERGSEIPPFLDAWYHIAVPENDSNYEITGSLVAESIAGDALAKSADSRDSSDRKYKLVADAIGRMADQAGEE
jgi:TIR domain